MNTTKYEHTDFNSLPETELAISITQRSEKDYVKTSPNSLYSCSSLSSQSSKSSRCSLISTSVSSSSTMYSNYSDSRKEKLEISYYESQTSDEVYIERKWLFNKLLQWLNYKSSSFCNQDYDCSSNGVTIVGGPGCGKSALFDELTKDNRSSDSCSSTTDKLASRIIAHFKCDKNFDDKINLPRFILSIRDQILNSNLPIASFYKNFLERNNERTFGFFTNAHLCVAPDEVFQKGILDILNEYTTDDGSQSYVILIDSIDESTLVHSGFSSCFRDELSNCESPSAFYDIQSYHNKSLDSNLSSESPRNFNYSQSIAELISNNMNHIPKWLSFIVSCSRVNRIKMGKLFPKFQRLTLDDLRRPSVLQDIQQYMLKQIENDKTLQNNFRSQEGISALQQINIKSNGCILFVKIVLHGSKHGWINLKDIASIPGTLNGLYLWLCDYLFPVDSKVIVISEIKTILELVLASRNCISLSDLYQALKLHDKNYSRKILESNLHAMSRILDKKGDNIKFFHDSFANWIKDIKHCTENYFCDESRGHEILANYMIDKCRLYPFKNIKEIYRLAEHCVKAKDRCKYNTKEIANLIKFSKIDLKFKGSKLIHWNLNLETERILLAFGHEPIFFNTLKAYKEEMDHQVEALEAHEKLAITSISNLCNAVYQGDIETVKSLLDAGIVNLNSCNSNGSTALNLAARRDCTDMVEVLLNARADVNQIDTEGWSPLRSAAWSGCLEIVKLLLENGAQVDLTSEDQRTALRAASWAGHEKIVELLIEYSADIDKSDAEGRTPLIAAAYMGNADVLQILVNHNANLNHADNDGRTALNVAAVCVTASADHRRIVEILLRSKADPDIPDNENITPLLGATYNFKDRLDICQTLIEFGADINKKDKLSFTPLLIASSQGCLELVKLFLLWEASIDIYDNAGRSALTLAAIGGFDEVIQELLNRGLTIDHKDNTGSTSLHYAAANGHMKCLKLLIEHGSKLDNTDNASQTPLLLATQYNKTLAALYLISPETQLPASLLAVNDENPRSPMEDSLKSHMTTNNGPYQHLIDKNTLMKASRRSINMPSCEGMTPLRAATLNKNTLLVEILQIYRADPNLQDSYGRTILYLLALEGDTNLTQRLIYAHSFVADEFKSSVILANPVLADDEGRCPLHVAAWQGHLDLAKTLVMAGVPIDVRDKEGRTSLQSAAWQGDAAMCQLLLNLGAQVDVVCKQSATALCISAQENHVEVCRVLLLAGADPYQTDAFGRSAIRVAKKANHREICQLITSMTSDTNVATRKKPASLSSLQAPTTSSKFISQPVQKAIQNEYDTEYNSTILHSQPSQPMGQTQSHYQNLVNVTTATGNAYYNPGMNMNSHNSLQSRKTLDKLSMSLSNKMNNSSSNYDNDNPTSLQYIPPSNDFYQKSLAMQAQLFPVLSPNGEAGAVYQTNFNQSENRSSQSSQIEMTNQWVNFVQKFDQPLLMPPSNCSDSNPSLFVNINSNMKPAASFKSYIENTQNSSPHMPIGRYSNNHFIPISETINFDDEGNSLSHNNASNVCRNVIKTVHGVKPINKSIRKKESSSESNLETHL